MNFFYAYVFCPLNEIENTPSSMPICFNDIY